jgi:hypothetical protein
MNFKRKTKEEKESFERHMNYVITFFNSPDMVKWESDQKERLNKWRKLTEKGSANVTISKEEAKYLR